MKTNRIPHYIYIIVHYLHDYFTPLHFIYISFNVSLFSLRTWYSISKRRHDSFTISSTRMHTYTIESSIPSQKMTGEERGEGTRSSRYAPVCATCCMAALDTRCFQTKTRSPQTRARVRETRNTPRSREGNLYVPVRPDGSWLLWLLGNSGTVVGCCCPEETAPSPSTTSPDTIGDRSHDWAILSG